MGKLWLALAVVSLLGVRPVAADTEALAALADRHTHAIMRHALAPGYSDPANFDVENCATQRNLDAAGRRQAEATGAAFRAVSARIDAVWTSQWCRCKDTANLMALGTPVEVPALNSFFEHRHRRDAQTEALRQQLSALGPEVTTVLVTHQVNISALLGRSTRSGEVVVFTIAQDGETRERGSFVLPAE